MPVLTDFGMIRADDGILVVTMSPPVNITNWNVQFVIGKRFGGDTINYRACLGSGFILGQSGITTLNATDGIFSIAIPPSATSELEFGNYSYKTTRTDSGSRTVLSEGYMILYP